MFLYQGADPALDATEVEVRFEPIEHGSLVTLQHRGWENAAPEIVDSKRNTKRWGWASILGWYSEWAFWGSPRRVAGGPGA